MPLGPKAAERDSCQDGSATDRLGYADRIAEEEHAGGRADERLEVDEGTRDLG
jgi:hypothetical protein